MLPLYQIFHHRSGLLLKGSRRCTSWLMCRSGTCCSVQISLNFRFSVTIIEYFFHLLMSRRACSKTSAARIEHEPIWATRTNGPGRRTRELFELPWLYQVPIHIYRYHATVTRVSAYCSSDCVEPSLTCSFHQR